MSIFETLGLRKAEMKAVEPTGAMAVTTSKDEDIFKAFIPEFLYKPPYGYPRKENLPFLRDLAMSPYVFSVIKTLCDEASSLEWEIIPKEDVEMTPELETKIKEITTFFQSPNENKESFQYIIRSLVRDILELDSGIIVKVFNRKQELSQIFTRDGSLFLKNPDIHGYIGNRAEFVTPVNISPELLKMDPITGKPKDETVRNYYDSVITEQAAYFQYGWTPGSMPVPFGTREIVYIIQNARSDSIYGRSGVQVLGDIIQTLIYGGNYNLDFYLNGNMPEGVIQLLGAKQEQMTDFRQRFEQQYKQKDALGNNRRVGYRYPITNVEAKFVPFALSSKDMQIIEQQTWFIKLVWAVFGVTAEEMGFTFESNKAISQEQSKVFKRKAIRPIINILQYHFDNEIIPEFFKDKLPGEFMDAVRDTPLMFKFKDYDVEEDMKMHNILEQEIRMGVKTAEMVAGELGINIDELKKSKEEAMTLMQENQVDSNGNPIQTGFNEKPKEEKPKPKDDKKKEKEKEVKALTPEKELTKELTDYIKAVADEIIDKVGE